VRPVYIPVFKRPALKRTQSDLCLSGKDKPAKSVVPGQRPIKNIAGTKSLADTIEQLKLAPPPPSLEEVRKQRAEDKATRRKAIDFLRARTKIRLARIEAAEKKDAEKEGTEKKTMDHKAGGGKEGVDDGVVENGSLAREDTPSSHEG
jgi:hypothetical protein